MLLVQIMLLRGSTFPFYIYHVACRVACYLDKVLSMRDVYTQE
jgi:hypothetical protein